jgi:hypothetical protein
MNAFTESKTHPTPPTFYSVGPLDIAAIVLSNQTVRETETRHGGAVVVRTVARHQNFHEGPTTQTQTQSNACQADGSPVVPLDQSDESRLLDGPGMERKNTMKAIINGKRYNTETAEKLASWGNGRGTTDFHFVAEELYRTRNGALFMAGEGGALSRYSEPCGHNGSCGGSRIEPMTTAQALNWLESRSLTEEIEKHFPQAVQDA